MITCRTLGPLAVTVNGAEPPPELLWRKHLALLVYLARSPRRSRSREHLVGLLWADKPETAARHSLREAVRVLRHCAGEAAVETSGEQVRLAEGVAEFDVDQLALLAAEGDWASAATLVTGEFLEGFSVPDAPGFDDWLGAERTEWRRRSVDVLLHLTRAITRAGHAADAVTQARRALALDVHSEPAAAAAMHALALAGERTAALETYRAFEERLRADLNAAPGDELQRLAARVRDQRAWRVPESETVPAIGAESRRAPLIGREQTLGAVLAAWEECRTGPHAALAIVEGDAGTGRTRFVEEILARARLDGAGTTAARAVPADQAEPWSGVLGLARGGLLAAPGVAAAPAGALAAFATRLADWGDRFPEARRAVPGAPGQALAEVLRAATDERPVLLALDDGQWSDRESLLALDGALRDLAAAPLFVLVTTVSFAGREELDRLCGRIGRDVAGSAVRLTTLDRDALRRLAAWALPGYGEAELDRVARRIAADSAGLPLLAVELLHAVALGLDLPGAGAEGAWPAEHRTLDQTMPGDLPDAVTAAIRVGFRRLSKDARALLTAASVLGDRAPAVALGRATGLDGERLTGALDELEWQRWLTSEPRGYSFVARVVRDVVAREMLTDGQRRRLLEAAGLKAPAEAG
ncbi:MAG TPA: AAA family ATPase [Gemmatimonadales bacterium]|nr:AAA family ATPase [Gemmatimonadales bacterium]